MNNYRSNNRKNKITSGEKLIRAQKADLISKLFLFSLKGTLRTVEQSDKLCCLSTMGTEKWWLSFYKSIQPWSTCERGEPGKED